MEVCLNMRPQHRPFKRQWLFAAALSVWAVSLLAGCKDGKLTFDSTKQSGGMERLDPRGVAFLEEVPVPDGFKLVDSHSMDHESAGQRMARHEYRGKGDPFAVRNFYRQQMPQTGWERVSDQSVKGVITMRFEKRREVCTVQIREADFGRSVINVEVVPFSRTSLEPPKQR